MLIKHKPFLLLACELIPHLQDSMMDDGSIRATIGPPGLPGIFILTGRKIAPAKCNEVQGLKQMNTS